MTSLYIENAAAVSPLGNNLTELWHNILAGESRFDHASLPGQRRFFAAETQPGSASDISAYASLFSDTIRQLVDDLHIDSPVDAIFFATAVGNLADVENDIYAGQAVLADKIDFAAIEQMFAATPAMGPDTRFVCVPTGCCAGLQAIGLARSSMARLGLKRAIIMSLDFGLTPMAFEAFNNINATSEFDQQLPTSPSRPFCRQRSGFLFADGGGAILVNTDNSDNPRISGYGCVSSAFHMTDIDTDGHSIRQSIERALSEARLAATDIDHINLHASGTQQNDEAEYQALVQLMGEQLPEITAFKGNHGHALGGANLIEVALAWKMLEQKMLPPTPEGLPVDAFAAVPAREAAQPFAGRTILKTASGFSGIHAAIVMER